MGVAEKIKEWQRDLSDSEERYKKKKKVAI